MRNFAPLLDGPFASFALPAVAELEKVEVVVRPERNHSGGDTKAG
jgi:hypothetical protein